MKADLVKTQAPVMVQNASADVGAGVGKDFTAPYRSLLPLNDARSRYPGFLPGRETYRRGQRLVRGARPLPCDIDCDRDVEVTLRDGCRIYVDVFRPAGASGPLPALVSWSPYGKRGSTLEFDEFPFRAGVPRKATSGLEKFEGPDPAEWCAHGYAVINPDSRGAFMSQGDMAFWGEQEGRDGHDLIEWVAAQPWSNEKVGLSGNSWLALAQWFIAAQRPPHLAAIAPWEGVSDLFREVICLGGMPALDFSEWVIGALVGNGRVEDPVQALRLWPHWAPYWEDKCAAVERINVPAYVVASWTNILHVTGTLRGFSDMGTREKWLRVHDKHEWVDYYDAAHVADLRRFFDHFLMGQDNGWLATPRVRMAVLDPGHAAVPRTAETYPPAGAHQKTFYLDAKDGALFAVPPTEPARCGYEADAPNRAKQRTERQAEFTIRFDSDIEFCGPAALHLWVEAQGHDDMDLFVHLAKLDAKGRVLPITVIPLPYAWARALTRWKYKRGDLDVASLYTPGPTGRLRASMRELDEEKSTPVQPKLRLKRPQLLGAGEVVPVSIALRPMGWRFHAGEQLRIVIAGHDLDPMGIPGVPPISASNRGRHVIHTGGACPSQLVMLACPAGSAHEPSANSSASIFESHRP